MHLRARKETRAAASPVRRVQPLTVRPPPRQNDPKQRMRMQFVWSIIVICSLLTIIVGFGISMWRHASLPQQPVSDNSSNKVSLGIAGSTTVATATSNPTTKASSDSFTPHTDQLPEWLRTYIHWHRETLQKFPGEELFTNPNAPNVLVRFCGLCGGLHDRLGQLPWDLYLANQTNRIFLIIWHRPRPLESFLMPNEINWTVPTTQHGFETNKDVRGLGKFFGEHHDSDPDCEEEANFWNETLGFCIERATTGEYRNVKVLRHRLLGHLNEHLLEHRLRALGETDMLHWTPSFGHLFRAMFQPSPAIQHELDTIGEKLNLRKGRYSAAHCRVRHPKATPSNKHITADDNSPADKSGLPWYGKSRDFALAVGTKAILCARTLLANDQEPLYFYADSNDLVRYMAHELKNISIGQESSLVHSPTDADALQAVQPIRVVARDMSKPNVHIDRQKHLPAEDYYATFVDLFLAINARCVTFGVGYFAVFATKISGIACKLRYQDEEWGGKANATMFAPMCTQAMYQHLL